MATFSIPKHWSGEQALAVCDLLEELHKAICNHYEQRLIPIVTTEFYDPDDPTTTHEDENIAETDVPFEDDLPF